MSENKFCPMKATGPNSYAQEPNCEEEKCAWWCKWCECCALVAIPAHMEMEATHGKD